MSVRFHKYKELSITLCMYIIYCILRGQESVQREGNVEAEFIVLNSHHHLLLNQ
jgi:hypothetical protein